MNEMEKKQFNGFSRTPTLTLIDSSTQNIGASVKNIIKMHRSSTSRRLINPEHGTTLYRPMSSANLSANPNYKRNLSLNRIRSQNQFINTGPKTSFLKTKVYEN